MFDRVKLKENAKQILTRNYWWIVLVTLILGVAIGSSGTSNSTRNYNNNRQIDIFNDPEDEYIFEDGILGEGAYNDDLFEDNIFNSDEITNAASAAAVAMIPVFAIMMLIVLVITIGMYTFLLNPLQVGCRKWFLLNRTEKPKFGEIFSGFKKNYGNVVKIMFLRDLYIALWTLLFIIPGIIKAYEYRMVPFLLAENPEMTNKEALEASRQLMNGNKLDAWVLDLSFIGWNLLSVLTCGVLGVFYVDPYIALTDTELYVCLCQGKDNYQL